MKAIHALVAGTIAAISTAAPVFAIANTAITTQPQPDLMAQAPVRDYCRSYESLFVAAETQDYWVSICGSDLPNTYVGVNKHNGDAIRVPLHSYDRDFFEAINGDTTYILARSTTRGSVLTVTQMPGYREILRQPVLRWE